MRVFFILGTRPEAIKLAPVILAAREHPQCVVTVCQTGQHADMCDEILGLFGIETDYNLAVMTPGQTLPGLTAKVLGALDGILGEQLPNWLIVQGDTTTAFAASLAAFYRKIPVAHVEAGLRTGNVYAPWPEEMNRRLISRIGALHFSPLDSNVSNLLREGIDPSTVVKTGNTGIDALKWLVRNLATDAALAMRAEGGIRAAGATVPGGDASRLVLITAHRRESFDGGLEEICNAISDLARKYQDREFVYPVHPNPVVRDTVSRILGALKLKNVHLIRPLDYLPFVALLSRAELAMTDSGGIQEEAPSLGVRTIVMREVTERMEGVEAGLVRLTGVRREAISAAADAALQGAWRFDGARRDIYGDGRASQRIVDALVARAS